jgi:hypothetical protein
MQMLLALGLLGAGLSACAGPEPNYAYNYPNTPAHPSYSYSGYRGYSCNDRHRWNNNNPSGPSDYSYLYECRGGPTTYRTYPGYSYGYGPGYYYNSPY